LRVQVTLQVKTPLIQKAKQRLHGRQRSFQVMNKIQNQALIVLARGCAQRF
jgi:hypothetical protein